MSDLVEEIEWVSTHSIRYRILKLVELAGVLGGIKLVSTHSIRYRILKLVVADDGEIGLHRFNPFDPIQDTETCRSSAETH